VLDHPQLKSLTFGHSAFSYEPFLGSAASLKLFFAEFFGLYFAFNVLLLIFDFFPLI